jgi:hypothetical protein
VEERVSRLEEGTLHLKSAVGEVQTTTNGLEATGARLETGIAENESMVAVTLPHLATNADVAELRLSTMAGLAELRTKAVAGFAYKSGRTYVCDILAGPLAACACGVAAPTS